MQKIIDLQMEFWNKDIANIEEVLFKATIPQKVCKNSFLYQFISRRHRSDLHP